MTKPASRIPTLSYAAIGHSHEVHRCRPKPTSLKPASPPSRQRTRRSKRGARPGDRTSRFRASRGRTRLGRLRRRDCLAGRPAGAGRFGLHRLRAAGATAGRGLAAPVAGQLERGPEAVPVERWGRPGPHHRHPGDRRRQTHEEFLDRTWSPPSATIGIEPGCTSLPSPSARCPRTGEIEFANPRPDEPSRAFFRDLVDDKRDFKIAICYCSVLDYCWVARYGGVPAHERDLPDGHCPIAEQDRFRN